MIITTGIDQFAEAIFFASFNVLLCDHKNFGHSGGKPRQEMQTRGYRDAVNFLRSGKPECLIALWGDSYSAALALVAGALIDDVSAVVAQIPVCGVELPKGLTGDSALAVMKDISTDADVSGGIEHTVGPLPVVSSDQLNTPSLLTPIL